MQLKMHQNRLPMLLALELGDEARLFNDVKGRIEATLDFSEGVKDNETKVLRDQKGHQNRSQAFLAGVVASAES